MEELFKRIEVDVYKMGDNNVCLALCDLDRNNANQDMYSVSFSAESDTRYHLDFFSLTNNGAYI